MIDVRGSARGNRHWSVQKTTSSRKVMEEPSPFRVRLLGELQLIGCDGRPLVLPASRKTRALLGYLIATGQAHRRERLCDLFWDGPDDPRAELRWSLSKIRPLLAAGGGAQLAADRERVGIELGNAVVDLLSVRSLLGNDVSVASDRRLKEAASLFRRRISRRARSSALLSLPGMVHGRARGRQPPASRRAGALVERLQDRPADAWPMRALSRSGPLSNRGMRRSSGCLPAKDETRKRTVITSMPAAFSKPNSGAPPFGGVARGPSGAAICHTGPRFRPTPRARAEPVSRNSPPHTPSPAPFVGRDAERALIQRVVAMTAERQGSNILVVTGEAGIGKSHLMARTAERMSRSRRERVRARVYEAEAARPYGVWIDILRAVSGGRPREASRLISVCSSRRWTRRWRRPEIEPGCSTPSLVSCDSCRRNGRRIAVRRHPVD